MIEHELLRAVAAPLLVLGRPLLVLLWALPRPARRRLARWSAAPALRRTWLIAIGPVAAWAVHTLALWVWHAPALFGAALQSETIHLAQHASFLGAALVYWSSLYANRHAGFGHGAAVLSLFATSVQCALLGALLTVAAVPWYPDYPGLED
jgi:cytochrome c oxidase assembly factor CtaG